jgi:hypothetical protein
MSHPNEDFIKRFIKQNFESQTKKPIIEEAFKEVIIKSQKEIEESSKNPIKVEKVFLPKKEKPIVTDKRHLPTKKDILLKEKAIEKKYKSISPKELVEQNALAFKAPAQIEYKDWQPFKTPFGIFYFNKDTNQWMNNFGIIKNTLNDFLAINEMLDYETIDSDSKQPEQIKASFFSDDGSYIGYYDSKANAIDVYSVDYSPSFSLTLENTLSLGSVPFNASATQKCFISNDGNYVVLSIPSNKTVYFLDAASDTLLQTITEDYPQFGSRIAVDKDFYGLVVSSTELQRSPDIYDTRTAAFEVSTKVFYYKRNYLSSSAQRFNKIHMNHAWMQHKKTGADAVTVRSVNPNSTISTYGVMSNDSGDISEPIVAKVSDLVCKGYNWAFGNIATPSDQVNYRTSSFNADSPRYSFVYEGITASAQVGFVLAYKFPYTEPGFTNQLPSDADLNANFKLFTTPTVKKFTIARKLMDNTIYEDKSYMVPITNGLPYQAVIPMHVWGLTSGSSVGDIVGITFFNNVYAGTYVEKIFGRTLHYTASLDSLASPNLTPLYDEYVIDTKIGINDSFVYDVSTLQTGTGGQYTKILKINRHRLTTEEGSDTYLYQDFIRTSVSTNSVPTPAVTEAGTIKVLYDSSKNTLIENTYYGNTGTPALLRRSGINPTKPYLSNPSSYPSAEFAMTISPDTINEGLNSIFVSNTHLFLNFDSQTLVFSIDNVESYKPLIYETSILNLKDYKFTYNASGIYFAKENNIYQFNTATNSLVLLNIINN